MTLLHRVTASITLIAFSLTACVGPGTQQPHQVGSSFRGQHDATTLTEANVVTIPSGTYFFFDKEGLKYAYLYKLQVAGRSVSGYVMQRLLDDVDYNSSTPQQHAPSDNLEQYSGTIDTNGTVSVSFGKHAPYNLPVEEKASGGRTHWKIKRTTTGYVLDVPQSGKSGNFGPDGPIYENFSATVAQCELPASATNGSSSGGGEIAAAGLAIGMILILWGGAKLLSKGKEIIQEGARLSIEEGDRAKSANAYKCPRCDGYGKVDPTNSSQNFAERMVQGFITCPRCDGTGWLKNGQPYKP
jgi:hypothetical protein